MNRTTREKIADVIRAEVVSKVLTEGTPLREEALAKRFGVSRIPVRDALLQLTQEGWLVSKHNFGVRVAALPNTDLQPLIVSVRRSIESFALKSMMKRLKDVDLTIMDRILKDLHAACKKGEVGLVVDADMSFHRFIITSANTSDLMPLWLPVITRMMLHYSRHANWMESYHEHANIASAIRDGNTKKAMALLKANIS